MLELFEGKGMEERPSFIVTGASASGKTTLVREAQGIANTYQRTRLVKNVLVSAMVLITYLYRGMNLKTIFVTVDIWSHRWIMLS